MKYNIKKSLRLCAFTLLITGCSNTSPVTSGVGTSSVYDTYEYKKHLRTDNQDLSDVLSITDVKSRVVNGLTEVNVELKSSASKTEKLQYQFTWFDAQGFIVEANKTPWKSLSLHGGQIKTLRSVAPLATATTFSVYVRNVHSKAYEFEKE